MNIAPPSYEVLDHLDQESLAVRIELCGRICYKSEDRIDRDSAIPFVSKMAEHGHNSVLEMGVVTLEVICADEEQITDFFLLRPRYLHINREANRLLITGSIRSFRELLLFHPENAVIRASCALINERHPYFFKGVLPQGGLSSDPSISVRKVELDEVDQLPPQSLLKHRHIAVKFIVNRAVTHEIVRHRPCSFLQESQRYCRYSEDKFGNEVSFIKPMFFEEDSPEYTLWKKAMLETEQLYLKLLETSTPQAARTVLPNSCKTELIVYANLKEWQHIFSLRTTKAAEPSMREVMIPLLEDFKRRFPGVFT
ncbi:MAG: FAD-dependent thymidylate synthase [Candidatus Electrothrix aestuarii]|uniref:FAD-dependent thymidylate synthase n=1 Tax=Candidatus Electrothrix aestuarii TaxID=3062594 RepID=A0AAU8M0N2_9BACT|nr:FAD-dependent thymidylate synthase [Candidatus Electrothrix aestuarii]